MKTGLAVLSVLGVVSALLLPRSVMAAKDAAALQESGELQEVQKLQLEQLKSVTSVNSSRDGKFLYAAAFNSHIVAAFKRDAQTGALEFIQSSHSPELQTAVHVRLSTDDSYAVACAFGGNAISLFRRDPSTGYLTWLSAARQGENNADGLTWVIDAAFSPDSRFLYTAAATGLGVFQITDDRLTFVQTETAEDRLQGVRAVVLSPDGETVYAAGSKSGTLGVLRRNGETGKLELLQVLTDGENGVESLAGAFRITVSKDGRHVYVSSGRFAGDQAITAFERQPDGKLKLIEAHVNGEGDFNGFEGGNSISLSPDGRFIYAVASRSDSLVRFRRDPEAGKLTFLGSQTVGDTALPGAAGLCFSPDGKFLYVADERSSSIVVYKQP